MSRKECSHWCMAMYSSFKICLDEMGGLYGVVPSSPLKAAACHKAYTKMQMVEVKHHSLIQLIFSDYSEYATKIMYCINTHNDYCIVYIQMFENKG